MFELSAIVAGCAVGCPLGWGLVILAWRVIDGCWPWD